MIPFPLGSYTRKQINNNDTTFSKITVLRQIAHLLQRVEKQRRRPTVRPVWLSPSPPPQLQPTSATPTQNSQQLSPANTAHVSEQASSATWSVVHTSLMTCVTLGTHQVPSYDAESPISSGEPTILSLNSNTIFYFQLPASVVVMLSTSSSLSSGKPDQSCVDAALLLAPGKDSLRQLTSNNGVIPAAANITITPRSHAAMLIPSASFVSPRLLLTAGFNNPRYLMTTIFSALQLPLLPGPKPHFVKVLVLPAPISRHTD